MESILKLVLDKIKDVDNVAPIVQIVMETIESFAETKTADKGPLFDDVITRIIHTPDAVPIAVQLQLKTIRDSGVLGGMVALICQAAKGVVKINAKMPSKCLAYETKCFSASWSLVQVIARAFKARKKSESKYVSATP